jgi:hypothetical protein
MVGGLVSLNYDFTDAGLKADPDPKAGIAAKLKNTDCAIATR